MQETEFYGVAFSFCDIMPVKFQILEEFRFFFFWIGCLTYTVLKDISMLKFEKQRIISQGPWTSDVHPMKEINPSKFGRHIGLENQNKNSICKERKKCNQTP